MWIETIQLFLSIAAPLAVSVGVIIAVLQLRNQNRLRQLDTVMRLYSTFGHESFARHFNRIAAWDFPSYEDYRQRAANEDRVALFVVGVFFENIGFLLKRTWTSIDLLDDLLSSPVLESWPRFQPIAVGMREEQGHPPWFEWFEYLHEAMSHRLEEFARA